MNLPYDFDLFFDIKTQEQLDREVDIAIDRAVHMILLMDMHGIKLNQSTISKANDIRLMVDTMENK
jgi:hypothetical protein